jgi:hypothetical protein
MSKKHREYNEFQVVNILSRKSDITFNNRTIHINRSSNAKGDIGIKSKGKIDYLVNFCGYILSAA